MIETWERESGPLSSNPGGLHTDVHGNKYYVKAYSGANGDDRTKNEKLTERALQISRCSCCGYWSDTMERSHCCREPIASRMKMGSELPWRFILRNGWEAFLSEILTVNYSYDPPAISPFAHNVPWLGAGLRYPDYAEDFQDRWSGGLLQDPPDEK